MSNLPPDDPSHLSAKFMLTLVESRLQPTALNVDDRSRVEDTNIQSYGDSSVESRILAKIDSAEQTQYDRYLRKPSSERDNLLSILRGWSSAVTLIEGSERLWRGGGYFIKWRGKGIVIDPGFDFLRNLHDAGYHGREIHSVLVSHNHPDHNSDLLNLDNLRYELFKRRESDKHGAVEAYTLIWDADSKADIRFSAERPEHQRHPILFDVGRCEPEYIIESPHTLPFSVSCFGVRHGDLHDAVGFKVILKNEDGSDFTIGYTGDTEFFPQLPERLANCDILLAHISQPDRDEFTDGNTKHKKIHLGYRGLADLIQHANPKLTLVGEFWAGLADLRIDLVQGLRRLAKTNNILPTGIGMHINIPDMTIACSECKKPTPYSEIRVAPPANLYGELSYLCTNCILT